MVLAFVLLLGCAGLVASSVTSYSAADTSKFTFVGRSFHNATSGGVSFDLEGTALIFAVSNATFIGLQVRDRMLLSHCHDLSPFNIPLRARENEFIYLLLLFVD